MNIFLYFGIPHQIGLQHPSSSIYDKPYYIYDKSFFIFDKFSHIQDESSHIYKTSSLVLMFRLGGSATPSNNYQDKGELVD